MLEVLNGYLILANNLNKKNKLNGEAFNFGPKNFQNKKVIDVLNEIKIFANFNWKIDGTKKFKSLSF